MGYLCASLPEADSHDAHGAPLGADEAEAATTHVVRKCMPGH